MAVVVVLYNYSPLHPLLPHIARSLTTNMARRSTVVWLAALVLMAMLVGRVAAGLYGGKSNVVDLTPKNFAAQVLASPRVWLVEFYAPWCVYRRHTIRLRLRLVFDDGGLCRWTL
jgi:hypothetical protein